MTIYSRSPSNEHRGMLGKSAPAARVATRPTVVSRSRSHSVVPSRGLQTECCRCRIICILLSKSSCSRTRRSSSNITIDLVGFWANLWFCVGLTFRAIRGYLGVHTTQGQELNTFTGSFPMYLCKSNTLHEQPKASHFLIWASLHCTPVATLCLPGSHLCIHPVPLLPCFANSLLWMTSQAV